MKNHFESKYNFQCIDYFQNARFSCKKIRKNSNNSTELFKVKIHKFDRFLEFKKEKKTLIIIVKTLNFKKATG